MSERAPNQSNRVDDADQAYDMAQRASGYEEAAVKNNRIAQDEQRLLGKSVVVRAIRKRLDPEYYADIEGSARSAKRVANNNRTAADALYRIHEDPSVEGKSFHDVMDQIIAEKNKE